MKENKPIVEVAKELERYLDKYEWFRTTTVEGNAVCVYVSTMNTEVDKMVPDTVYGYQVKLGYESYLTCGDKYGKKPLDILTALKQVDI